MMYSELLHSVSFDDIVPYIGKYGNVESMALYKTHYDMLKLLKPLDGDDDEKTVTISNAELYYDFEDPHLDAFPIEGCYWEEALAKEIIVQPDVNATWAEIAACLLWHTSFYGFTQDQREETFEKMEFYGQNLLDPDITRIRAKRVQKKIEESGGRIPSKKEILKVPAFKYEVNRKLHRGYHLPLRTKKRNLARRVINSLYWERILNIGTVISDCLPSEGVSWDDLYKVFLSNNYRTYRCQSYASDNQGRGKWLWELVTKYHAFYKDVLPKIVLFVGMSHEHPTTADDIYYVNEMNLWIHDQIKGEANIKWWTYYDDSLGEHLRLSALCYE